MQKRFTISLSLIFSLLSLTILSSCISSQGSDSKQIATTLDSMDSSFNTREKLGKLLFFEESLSTPEGQSCSSCHDPAAAFADPDLGLPVSRGAHPGRYGNRNDMPASYAAFAPPLEFNRDEGLWVGGLFWDGRVNTLAEQAKGPPLNPLEMANTNVETIATKLRRLSYASLFIDVYGANALSDAETAYDNMADAIEAYEKTAEVSPFTSKYDYWLKGQAQLSEQELRGLKIFEAEDKGNCAACHPSKPTMEGVPPLFTDYSYDNLGTPRNPENPFYSLPPHLNKDGMNFVDLGLGNTVKDPAQNGKFRVPTLRNVELTGPYMHNGVFKTLFTVVAFYNSRDVSAWPAPEVEQNINRDELGDLGLSNQELEDLVAFMETLTDGWNSTDNSGR